MNAIERIHQLGQSIWYDNIQRQMLENGKMSGMIQRGEIRGVTSNPSIFYQAIAKSSDYDAALQPLAWAGWDTRGIFWQLAIEDIRTAADLFRPLYEQSQGVDGYVSLEVDPTLAKDTSSTITEAQRLWDAVCRPNLMIKIPATSAGIPAIRHSLASGINVNVTLIFSLKRYAEVINAYMEGLEDRLREGGKIDRIASVASFFISRIDTKVDPLLTELEKGGEPLAGELKGKTAISNAKMAYALFCKEFSSQRFKKLEIYGAKVQRPLWASTSTKNPIYRDTLYVEELIGKDTVNTIPPQTLEAIKDHGVSENTLEKNLDNARQHLDNLEKIGISMEKVTSELEDEGVKAFSDAFGLLMEAIEDRRKQAYSSLRVLGEMVSKRVNQLDSDHVIERMFNADGSLWTQDVAGKEEIRRRLGWLHAPRLNLALVDDFQKFALHVKERGFTHVLVLGMGGSSLAPEVMSLAMGNKAEGLEVGILDSTHPVQVTEISNRFPSRTTLFIVASKSGGTAEVNAFLDYFWDREKRALGENTGKHFIAITDAGTSLEKLALERGFLKLFYGDPTVGGRFSALTPYGLVPGALMGIDIQSILDNANYMARQCTPGVPAARNPGLVLGAILGEACLSGRNKLMIMADEQFTSFGSWLEQLIAESSGKEGKGMVPVDGEPFTEIGAKGEDRLYVYFRSKGELDSVISLLHRLNQPVLEFPLRSVNDLGSEFYRWEIAIAVMCAIIGVNVFDQPDVQFNKTLTQKMIEDYRKTGTLVEGEPIWEDEKTRVFGKKSKGVISEKDIASVIQHFLSERQFGDYIAINAYIPRNQNNLSRLQSLRKHLVEMTGCAVTLGFGPRFLHSTGQLHKGGPNQGLFLEINDKAQPDVNIPGEGMSFGTLVKAQALGDFNALEQRERRVIRIEVSGMDFESFTRG